MRRTILFSFILLYFFSVNAQQRNINAAKALAANRLSVKEENLYSPVLSDSTLAPISFTIEDRNMPFYIFNRKDKHSFVIISGDERMKPILGYCNNMDFKPDKIPCGLYSLLSHYVAQYEFLNNNDIICDKQEKKQKKQKSIEPLLLSEWGQGSPYNDNCPLGCPSGCVATAMAQIMYYNKYPSIGNGFFSYNSRSNNFHLSYDFSKAFFDWSIMEDKYLGGLSHSSDSRKAVANLLEACGVSVGMDYERSGSGAYNVDIAYALINFFNYSKSVTLYQRSFFKNSEWYEKVFEELDAGRPILYCGVDSKNGGHAFIIDGYRQSDGKFHVNWGWDGDYNDYYELDALDPSVYKFSASQSMIVGFVPEDIGKREDVWYAESFNHIGRIEIGKSMNFTLKNLRNYSNSSSYVVTNSSFNGVVGIGLYDSDFNFIKSLFTQRVKNIRTDSGILMIDCNIIVNPNELENGEVYYIIPYAMSDESDKPTRIRTLEARSDYYSFTADGQEDDDSENSDTIPKTLVYEEGFESVYLPNGWGQCNIVGLGIWEGRKVLFGNDNSKIPIPAVGNGYVYLSYDSGSIFSNERTVTRLESPELIGEFGKQYYLSFQCRKYSSEVGKSEIVSILLNSNNEWRTISEITIHNLDQWLMYKIPFEADGMYKIGIEGSIEYGSNVFVDDFKVFQKNDLSSITPIIYKKDEELSCMYSIIGIMTNYRGKGLYLRKFQDGSIKKVFIK